MIHLLIFFIGVTVGAFVGFITTGFLTKNSNSDDLIEAYYEGIEEGKRIALNNNNNID